MNVVFPRIEWAAKGGAHPAHLEFMPRQYNTPLSRLSLLSEEDFVARWGSDSQRIDRDVIKKMVSDEEKTRCPSLHCGHTKLANQLCCENCHYHSEGAITGHIRYLMERIGALKAKEQFSAREKNNHPIEV